MRPEHKTLLIQISLFIVTLFTTTHAGGEWIHGKSIFVEHYSWSDFAAGLSFSLPFLFFLTVHEFGHYFTARYHKVDTTLPFYLPLPPLPMSIGTLGAVIRLKSRIYSKKINFDIGLSGPLAGFVASLIILFYGFTHLPEPEYIFSIHPEYEQYGLNYADKVYQREPGDENQILDIQLGNNLLFYFFKSYVADPQRVPNPHEIMHYPILLAGFLSLVFTSINLLPIGQLDGGHVTYGLFGFTIHRYIATVAYVVFLFYAMLGLFDLGQPKPDLALYVAIGLLFLYVALGGLKLKTQDTLMYAFVMMSVLLLCGWQFPEWVGFSGWLPFALVISRFIGIAHPVAEIEEPLDTKRMIMGWIALVIFLLSFTPAPLQ